jgi:hypothetical protein
MSRVIIPWVLTLAPNRIKPPVIHTALEEQRPSKAQGGINIASFGPIFDGRKLWAEIHWRALEVGGSGVDDMEFIDSVTNRLPCSTCRPHWLAFLEKVPPDFGPRYFSWTVLAHNEVNVRLGKPMMPLAEALEIWSGPRIT